MFESKSIIFCSYLITALIQKAFRSLVIISSPFFQDWKPVAPGPLEKQVVYCRFSKAGPLARRFVMPSYFNEVLNAVVYIPIVRSYTRPLRFLLYGLEENLTGLLRIFIHRLLRIVEDLL